MQSDDHSILYKEESYLIQGAIFKVYRVLGCGFIEAVYQESLAKELSFRNIPFKSQTEMTIEYKGYILNQIYRPDFLCYEQIILELKAVKDTVEEHKAQLYNYLKYPNYVWGCSLILVTIHVLP